MTPQVLIACHLDNVSLTVGEIRMLSCDLKDVGSKPESQIEFSFDPPQGADQNTIYDIQFLGRAQLEGTNVSQKVTSYNVGSHNLTSIKIKVDGQSFPVSSQSFEVKTVMGNQAGGQPTPFPLFRPEQIAIPWWWWASWGTLLFVVVGASLWKYLAIKKKRKELAKKAQEAKPLSPREAFNLKIRQLDSKGLHNRAEYKPFALELTTIVKKTIGEQLSFAAEDLTSEELLKTLERRHQSYFNTVGVSLEKFLSDLDQIKFAKTETDPARCIDLLDRGARIGNALFGGSS